MALYYLSPYMYNLNLQYALSITLVLITYVDLVAALYSHSPYTYKLCLQNALSFHPCPYSLQIGTFRLYCFYKYNRIR